MDGYIKIEDAAKAFSVHTPYCYEDCLNDLTSSILDGTIEAADVAPVVHVTPMIKCRPERYEKYEVHGTSESGETLYLKRIFVDEKNRVMYCQACGKRLCSRFVNYCPNCGAKCDLEG